MKRIIIISGLAALALASAGCGGGESEPAREPATSTAQREQPKTPEEITYGMSQICWDEMAANGGDSEATFQSLQYELNVAGVPSTSEKYRLAYDGCGRGVQAFLTGAGRP
jgi:hypothetical protein